MGINFNAGVSSKLRYFGKLRTLSIHLVMMGSLFEKEPADIRR